MSRLQSVEFRNSLHWAKGGLDTYRSIRTEGWKPAGWGVWGEGVYFAIDDTTAEMYENERWGDVCFAADVRLRRALVLECGGGHPENFQACLLEQYPYWARKGGVKASDPYWMGPKYLSQNLRDAGIDGVVVWERPNPTMGPGGNQVCVLNTDCITNLRLHKTHRGTAELRRNAARRRKYERENPTLGPPAPPEVTTAFYKRMMESAIEDYEAVIRGEFRLNARRSHGRITDITVS